MHSDFIWSIYPQAEADAITRINTYARHCWREGINDTVEAGPATDAGKQGLPIQVDHRVAVIDVMGLMMRRAGPFARLFGITGTDGVRYALGAALADKSVDRILLRIDSPGGSVAGLHELGDAVAAADKPTTAVVQSMAASAAYWIASQADHIVAGRGDAVGSIGVRTLLYDFSKMFEKDGVEAIPIDTGKFKSAGAMGTKITEEQRADFQRVIDSYFNDFVGAVARGRGMTEKQVREVGDGRIFRTEEAIQLGLVDSVGTFEQTLAELRSPRRQTDASRARLRI